MKLRDLWVIVVDYFMYNENDGEYSEPMILNVHEDGIYYFTSTITKDCLLFVNAYNADLYAKEHRLYSACNFSNIRAELVKNYMI